MKRLASFFAFAILLSACKKESDSTNNNSSTQELSPLAEYMDGKFDLRKVYYDGEVRSLLGTQALSAFGDSTEGFYNMYSKEATVSYYLSTFLEMEILGQQYNIPLRVGDSTTVEYDTDSSFVLTDKQLGTMRYVLGEHWPDSCRLHTKYEDDTVGFNMDLDLTMYLYRR